MKEEDEEDCDETGPSHGWKKEEAQLIKEVNTWNNLHVLPYQNWIQVYMLPLLTPLTPPSPLTYTGTNINSETGDPGSLHSSAALLPTWFPEPPFYTCLRLRWGSRDKILQKPCCRQEWGKSASMRGNGEISLQKQKLREKKWHSCSYFLVLRHIAQIDLET